MRLKCTNPNCDNRTGRVIASIWVLVKFGDDPDSQSVQVVDGNEDAIAERILKEGTTPETTPIVCDKCSSPMILVVDEEEYVDSIDSEERASQLLGGY